MAGSTEQPQPHPAEEPAGSTHPSRGENAYAAGGMAALEPISHMGALRDAMNNGHPILHEVDQPDWGKVFSETLCSEPTATGSTSSRIERFTSHTIAVDRLRAAELVHMAAAVLSSALSSDEASARVARLFASTGEAPPTNGRSESSAFSAAPMKTDTSSTDPAMEAFCTRAEYILNTAEETAISARVNSRLGNTRRLIGQAVTAYVGTPLLLRALLEGRLRFNRWEAVIRKFAWLPLAHLHALDQYIAGLDPRFSLHQFMRKVGEFIASIVDKPILAARVRKGRRTWIDDLPGGESILCLKGPTPLIHAHRNEGEALARAAVKGQVNHLDITPVEKTVFTAGDAEPSTAHTPSGVTTPMSATDELPPQSSLSVADERMVQQLTFDALISARPRTETVLEEFDHGNGTSTRYRVEIACPDEATVLRKHAVVVVTVPMTTLLGVDDRPGMIAGAPVPADMARMIASKSTVWYRMLTDPASGQVLDEVALKYEPDRATRIAVQGKWQTCTAPGCARPALQCEIDHGIPFNRSRPEQGGRTEPANLHPLCKRHHQAKTEGKLRMRRVTADEIEWLMPIGTASTAVAPSVDDGGVLSAACSPHDSPGRADARRVISERSTLDPATKQKAADAVYATLWHEFVAEQKAWDRSMTQRALVREELTDTKKKLEAQMNEQREELTEREARVDRRAFETLLRDDRVTRDERLLALQRAQWEHQKRERSLIDRPVPDKGRTMFKTIIPMRVEAFDMGPGTSFSVHSPIFPHPAFRKSRDRDNDELFSSDSARRRVAEEPWEPGGKPDVLGYEIRGREWQKVSPAMDSFADALYELEASRAQYVTIAFDQAAWIEHPRKRDLSRIFGRPEPTGRSSDEMSDQMSDGATEEAEGASNGAEDPAGAREQERQGRGLIDESGMTDSVVEGSGVADRDVPPPF